MSDTDLDSSSLPIGRFTAWLCNSPHASHYIPDVVWDKIEDSSSDTSHTPSQLVEKHANPSAHLECVFESKTSSYRVKFEGAELELKMVGRVSEHNLPPFKRQLLHRKHIMYLLQRISVVGGGSRRFATNADAFLRILDAVSRVIPLQTDMASLKSVYEGITASNRVFSAKDYIHEQHPVAIPFSIDPTGAVAKAAAAANLVHLEENEVEYLQVSDGTYSAITPASIKTGDIIELRFCIAFFHNSPDSVFPRLLLRAAISHDQGTKRPKVNERAQASVPVAEHRLKRHRVETTEYEHHGKTKRLKATSGHVPSDGQGALADMEVDVESMGVAMLALGISADS
ncbi:hypothetical protein AURDEDRAFT_130635 [Auricularia subglabra TFB-10046 SS5]|uniref:Uncharacterized protein n=1 Tax=Auricularia subglabra (strain TFB-10046 / SS5) TaxID=717982 RepID=J0WRU4_AURST|nr:hypothetical protein AURDEDRAFT_130635 [Auricularia subglabra TFB-10046 SS5]